MAEPWNRCDVCGRFIPIQHFYNGGAIRQLLTPDAERIRKLTEALEIVTRLAELKTANDLPTPNEIKVARAVLTAGKSP